MFNWIFRRKEEVPTEVDYNPTLINEENPFNPIGHDIPNKGISKSASKINPYRATLTVNTKDKSGKPLYHNVHIGVYKTKEEAYKARIEFIENLK